jgi:hypothetical protein
MSPADIAGSADFRIGLARRLADVGLVPPEPAARLVALADGAAKRDDEGRKAA